MSSAPPKPPKAPFPSAGPSPAEPAETGIPMLTDVLQVPRYQGTELPSSLNEVKWPELELRIQENVMERLMRRSNILLEEQMDETVRGIFDRSLQSLTLELQDALSRVVRDVVASAVAEELTRVHTAIAQRRLGSSGRGPKR